MKRNFLGLIAKYPEPGLVKTRLAACVGAERAANIYKVIAEKVFRQTKSEGGEYRRVIFYEPYSSEALFEDWLPGERFMPQRGCDIGEIMANALADLFECGAERAVIAGVDIPDLDEGIIRNAFSALDDKDVVIGPALDGGYYLIGMKERQTGVFRRINWSTERVLVETIGAIEEEELTYILLESLSDVDRIGDVMRLPDNFK